MTDQKPRVGCCWRPWGMDALATVTAVSPGQVTVRYDHDDKATHALTRHEFATWGRVVRRGEFARHKRAQARAALDAAHDDVEDVQEVTA